MSVQHDLHYLNADMGQRVVLDTRELAWQPSPSPAVWRKRLHLAGSQESAQVTSLVRFDPGSRFPRHGHPAGEEILVLDGVFSDEQGDWPAGSFLLNAEGFSHAPWSEPGCQLFVKLQQYDGAGRRQVALDTANGAWQPGPSAGVFEMPLYAQEGFADNTRLERWEPGAEPGPLHWTGGVELMVLEGGFEDELGSYGPLTWLRLPAGTRHRPRSPGGCRLYIKADGLAGLRTAPPGR